MGREIYLFTEDMEKPQVRGERKQIFTWNREMLIHRKKRKTEFSQEIENSTTEGGENKEVGHQVKFKL